MMDHLQNLVRAYAENRLDYAQFRARFVADFLAAGKSLYLVRLCSHIEGLCLDAEQGHIPEPRLKAVVAGMVLPPQFLPTIVVDGDVVAEAASANNVIEYASR